MPRPYSLYDVLSVTPDAQPVVIEAAYRALMKQHHPDHSGAAGRAAEINAAYSVLRDPQRRATYDQREWARKQEMLDADAEHLIAPSRFAARAGWFVAALLGLLVAGLAGGRYGLTVVPERAEPTRTASAKAQAQRAKATLEDDLDDAAIAALALSRPVESAATAAAVPVAASAPAPVEARGEGVRPQIRLRRRQAQQPVAAQERPAPQPEAAEGEFLEREGFIY